MIGTNSSTATNADLDAQVIVNAFARLVDLGEIDGDGSFAPRALPLSATAAATFEQFRQFLHAGKQTLDGREREWWAKGATQVLRLAGTLSLLSWAWTAERNEPKEIDADYIEAATTIWHDYFWPHSRVALRQVGLSKNQGHARRALRWIREVGVDQVSVMDIRRDALGQSLNAEQTETILDSLCRSGWLRKETAKTGGRPSHRWLVNPALHFSTRNAESAGTAESLPRDDLSALPALSANGRADSTLHPFDHLAPANGGAEMEDIPAFLDRRGQ